MMQIEMTGKEDRQGPWKFGLAGPPGSGKTMMSSTAPDPLFVFFQQEPRIKSVADRAIQHVKIVNDFSNNSYAIDQMNALLMHLQLAPHDFKSLVIDTGDEFFQQMKTGRMYQNGGEWGPGDWNWIADAYREVMLGLIDLPMNVIVTFHTKSTSDEEHTFKELMLQGQAKDEANGWFDIVGALDTYEVVDEHGETITKRVLLTSSSRTYPWVKDHSGTLPRRFDISPNITDDIPRILEMVSAETGTASREVVAEIAPVAPVIDVPTTNVIPSPEDLADKKKEGSVVEAPIVSEPPPVAPIDKPDTSLPPALEAEKGDPMTVVEPPVEVVDPEPVDSQASVESAAEPPNHIEAEGKPLHQIDEATEAVQNVLSAEEVFSCNYEKDGAVCGVDVSEDEDLRELTQIRFREYLCRPHFKQMLDEQA